MTTMRNLDLEAIEKWARENWPASKDVQDLVDEVRYLRSMVAERNDWARQLADVRDERDTARAQLDEVRSVRSEAENTVMRVEALHYEWERLGRGKGIHGRQLRRAIDGPQGKATP